MFCIICGTHVGQCSLVVVKSSNSLSNLNSHWIKKLLSLNLTWKIWKNRYKNRDGKIVHAAMSLWTCNSMYEQLSCKRYLNPQKEKRSHSSRKRFSLVFWKVKVKEGKMLPDLHNCYCNVTANLVFVLIVCASCSDYLEELTRENWGYKWNE